jgi:hypothetical protein
VITKRRAGWLACVALALGIGILELESWRRQEIPQQALLPVSFAHEDHRDVQCIDCHHNFVDGSGGGTCYACHKLDESIGHDIEVMFHEFCEGCHVEKRMEGEKSGPMRECSGCHVHPDGSEVMAGQAISLEEALRVTDRA